MPFLYAADALLSMTWCFGMMPTFCICSRACAQARISLPPVLPLMAFAQEELLLTFMNDHDAFVAKAGDSWELPHLIGVHCLLKLVDANKYILFVFMWRWVGSVRKYVKCDLFGGAYTLSLPTHVFLLRFFRLWEIVCNICDVVKGPRVVIAPLDRFEPRLFHWKSRRCM